MELILLALFISCFSVYFVDFTLIPEKLKRWWYYRQYTAKTPYEPYSIKPFDCSGCLTVWLYWIIGFILFPSVLIIPFGFVAGIASLIIKRLI